ncbi:MAG: hypothetical protein WAU88_14890, partial [Candidatus Zixiibacteriota bacterium]
MKRLVALLGTGLAWLFLAAVTASGTDYSGTARIDTLILKTAVTGNGSVVSIHTRTTILTAAGEGFGNCSATETPYRSIRNLQVQVFDQTGKRVVNHARKDLTRFCGYGEAFTLYQDNCSYDETPTAAAYPYSVVFDCEYELKSNFFLREIPIQRALPITYGLLVLTFPIVNPIHYKAYQFDIPAVDSSAGSVRTVTWRISNLPAAPDIANLPPYLRGGSRISLYAERYSFGEVTMPSRSWKNLGLVYKQLSDSRYLTMPDTIRKPESATAAHAMADRLYTELVKSSRYVSVNIGMSGWQPEFAAKTQTCGYGDCKGLTTLLVSRLRQSGIESYPCLVRTSDGGAPDTAFVNDDFNHVITMAVTGADTLWYDPTSQVSPAGLIPYQDQNTDVLVITDTGGVLVHTPSSTADISCWRRSCDISVDSTGMITAHVTSMVTGLCAATTRWGLYGETNDDRKRYVERIFQPSGGKYTVDSISYQNLDSTSLPLIVKARLRSERPMDRIGGVTYLLPFFIARRILGEGQNWATRTCPIFTGYPVTVIDSVTVHAPITSQCDSLRFPAGDSLKF